MGRNKAGYLLAAGLLIVSGVSAALAGEANVVAARAEPEGGGTWRFEVTIRHADAGWEHYADAYEVLDSQGRLLGRRVLLHPHVDEQPFTRSLSGVRIPEGLKQVRIRAHDSVHEWGGRELMLKLPR